MPASAAPCPAPLAGPLSEIRRILAAHWGRLGKKSRRLRFLGSPDKSFFTRFASRIDPLIVLGVTIEGEVRGVCEVHRLDSSHAEVAISIEDAWQGLGYGRALFEAGLVRAAEAGVETADLFFSSENRGIMHLVASMGGAIRRIGGDCEAHICLDEIRQRIPERGARNFL